MSDRSGFYAAQDIIFNGKLIRRGEEVPVEIPAESIKDLLKSKAISRQQQDPGPPRVVSRDQIGGFDGMGMKSV